MPDQNELTRFRKNLYHHYHDRIICISKLREPRAHVPRDICRTVLKNVSVALLTYGMFMHEAVGKICSRDAELNALSRVGRTELQGIYMAIHAFW